MTTLAIDLGQSIGWGRRKSPPPVFSVVDAEVSYDPITGIFTNKVSRGNLVVGAQCGSVMTIGYVTLRVGGRHEYGHQIAWLLMTGEWPTQTVDHRDLNRANNIWTNLRAATRSQQQQNQPTRKDNSSGTKGVCWSGKKRKWRAYVSVGGRQKSLGHFNVLEDAIAARFAGATETYGSFVRHA